MPDLAAGTTVSGEDTPPTVGDAEAGSYTTTLSANFGVTTSGGTYADCGTSFVAPTSGRVLIEFAGQLDNSSATGRTIISPYVRTGGTVGSGSDVSVAADAESVYNQGTEDRRLGAHTFVSGLTATSTYNVRLEHKVTGSTTGTISNRRVTVIPCT